MKVKNAMKSEECNDIKNVLALANELKKKADKLAAYDNAPSEAQSVCVKLAQVQTLLCTMFGAKLDETLRLAQEIEFDQEDETVYLSRSKPTEEIKQEENEQEETSK